MKIIATHGSPDLDAITSVWLIKKFLLGWENAEVRFVPAGERLRRVNQESRIKNQEKNEEKNHNSLFPSVSLPSTPLRTGRAGIIHNSVVEGIGEDEVIHVDTGLGSLDHHQTKSDLVCAASLTWDYVRENSKEFENINSERVKLKIEAVSRIVRVVVDIDHFKEVFWDNPSADYHEFSLMNVLDGLKLHKPDDDLYYVDFVSKSLDALLHEFENRIWAEKEIKEDGIKFDTRFGKGIGFETINDSVIKLAQKMGYVLAVRKDPRKSYVRIKAIPFNQRLAASSLASSSKEKKLNVKRYTRNADIDLTLVYEKFKKMDPDATWFLHVGKKMLLNGSVKNPKMRPTKLKLSDIIKVLEKI